jgi:hypothetical protein
LTFTFAAVICASRTTKSADQEENEIIGSQKEARFIDVFSTCPQSSQVDKAHYLKSVADVARWSEQYGCKEMLIYTDNSIVDPWLMAQQAIQQTQSLCPLVARPALLYASLQGGQDGRPTRISA